MEKTKTKWHTPKGGDFGDYLVGWIAIAKYLGLSVRTAQRLGDELKEAGVLRREGLGDPRVTVVACHKSILDTWIVLKTKKDGGLTGSNRSGKARFQYGKKGYDKDYEKKRG